uniref:Uncharacterized protein n=1 Tax=Triticum urartu TaxID=4572 RepID=A0A8R7NYS7_TRIUA
MGMREWPLPRLYEVLHGEERGRWPPEARFLEAAHNGDVREIKKIAKELDVQGHGIRTTVANTTYMGMNALHAAGGGGKLPIYRYLVEEVKMDVDMPDTAQEFMPMSHAIMYGHLPAVRYLLDHGADLHQRRGKITLLHMAIVHGYYEIVKFLLARGANVHAMSQLGTPLMDATLRGFPSIVKILLEHKSDVLSKLFVDMLSLTPNSPLFWVLLLSPIVLTCRSFWLVTNHAMPKVLVSHHLQLGSLVSL